MSSAVAYAQNEAKQAEELKNRFLDKLANIDLKYAVAVPLILSVSVVLSGVGVEVHHQAELLKHGYATLQTYLNDIEVHKLASDSGVLDYIKAGMSDNLPAAGAKLQAVGLAMLGSAPVVAGLAALTKGFANITQFTQAKIPKAEFASHDSPSNTAPKFR